MRDLEDLEFVPRGCIRSCSGEVVPWPSLTVSIHHGTGSRPQALPNPAPEGLSNQKSQLGEKVLKKAEHEASTLFFNPAFVLELHMPGTRELITVSVFLQLSCLCPFLLLTFFSQKIMSNGFKGFLRSVDYVCAVVFHVVLNHLTKFLIFYSLLVNFCVISFTS